MRRVSYHAIYFLRIPRDLAQHVFQKIQIRLHHRKGRYARDQLGRWRNDSVVKKVPLLLEIWMAPDLSIPADLKGRMARKLNVP